MLCTVGLIQWAKPHKRVNDYIQHARRGAIAFYLLHLTVAATSNDISLSGTTSLSCAFRTTCQNCTSGASGCVWCPSSSTCLEASSSGDCLATPEAGPPTTSCGCANPTSTLTTCEACRSDIYCYNQWCPVEGKCYYTGSKQPLPQCSMTPETGSIVGPSGGSCSCLNPTSTLTSCEACRSDIYCYNQWCPVEGKCYYTGSKQPLPQCSMTPETGSIVGPSGGSCSCLNPTSTLTTCGACRSDIYCYNQWCPVEGKCYYTGSKQPLPQCSMTPETGSIVGPSGGSCSCLDPTQNFRTCLKCTENLSCHNTWCTSNNTCLYSGAGPLPCSGATQCSATCGDMQTCGQCTSMEGCKWCELNDACYTVDEPGNPCSFSEDFSDGKYCTCTQQPSGGVGVDACDWYQETTAPGTPPEEWKGGDFLPSHYMSAAVCSCNGGPPGATNPLWLTPAANCVRAHILVSHQQLNSTIKEAIKDGSYTAAVVELIHNLHADAYSACGCPGTVAPFPAWLAVYWTGTTFAPCTDAGNVDSILSWILDMGRCGCGW